MIDLLIAAVLMRLGLLLIWLDNTIPVIDPITRDLLRRIFCYPDFDYMRATEDNVTVHHATIQGTSSCWLQFGDILPGIRFEAACTFPNDLRDDCKGNLEFVQDVIVDRKRQPGDQDPIECWSSGGKRELDTEDPYRAKPVLRGGRNVITTNDSPASLLRHRELVTADDKFRMFLMWRPDRWGGLVRLPIAKIDWWWRGRGESSARPGDCTEALNAWIWISTASGHGHTPATRTSELPITAPNAWPPKWIKCP